MRNNKDETVLQREAKTAYQDTDLVFMMEGESVYVGNIVYERFHRSIPMHAHPDNSYEIHYISAGHGEVNVEGTKYDTVPGTLYMILQV